MFAPVAPDPASQLAWLWFQRRRLIDEALDETSIALQQLYAVRTDCTWTSDGVQTLLAALDEVIAGVEREHMNTIEQRVRLS